MQDPEERAYSGTYRGDPVGPEYGSSQFSEEYTKEGESQYQTGEWGQQKLQPTSRSEQAQRAMAIMLMIVTSVIMAISIALFALSVTNLAIGSGIALPQGLFGRVVASFALSLVMMLFSIAAFVASTIQLSLMMKGFRRSR
jgi:hypothetical protein